MGKWFVAPSDVAAKCALELEVVTLSFNGNKY